MTKKITKKTTAKKKATVTRILVKTVKANTLTPETDALTKIPQDTSNVLEFENAVRALKLERNKTFRLAVYAVLALSAVTTVGVALLYMLDFINQTVRSLLGL